MTAAYLTELGTPDVIRVGELPVPVPGPTDVLVRTEALAVNHVDTFIRSGAYRTYTPPDLSARISAAAPISSGTPPGGTTSTPPCPGEQRQPGGRSRP